MTTFSDLNLEPTLLKALAAKNHVTPTPIQEQAIPRVLEGRDVLGIAQTGTGKTAAFALPILQRLAATRQKAQPRTCRALVLSPTRELASQIAESFRDYGTHLNLTSAVVFGGVSDKPQAERLLRGVDILVATPGRLIDHLDQRNLRLDDVSIFVLDEADQMLDMGFIHAIRRLVSKLPKVRQNLFFSATMPREIGTLAGELLHDPAKVSVTPVASTVERIDQRVIFVETARKRTILSEILRDDRMGRTLVFTRTKHGADKVVRGLDADGISSAAIHGNKSQNQRERALAGFKAGTTKVLVATDIAARGIDISAVTHVINFDLPNVPESYVHRIGRTARAGADGSAISFCDGEERAFLRSIESLIRLKLPATDRRQPGAPAAVEPPPAPNRSRPQGRPPARNHARPAHAARSPGNGREGGDAHASRPAETKQWRRGRNRPKFENGRAPTPR